MTRNRAVRTTTVDVVFLVLLVAYGLVVMRGFTVQLAQLHEDDSPVLFALSFSDPGLLAGDYPIGIPAGTATPLKVVTSAMFWVPALAWRFLRVDPFPTTWVLTLLQGTSIGFALYVLSVAATRRRSVAALVAVFGYVATPWCWDPANYGGGPDWTFLPYAAHLAIAPILLSFASLLHGRDKLAIAFLAVAALIHPTLTLFACLILALYWARATLSADPRSVQAWWWTVALGAVGCIAVAPGLWLQLTVPGDPLSRADVMAGFRQNQHLWPWGYAGRWYYAVPTTLAWLLLGGLAWRERARWPSTVGRLWLAAVAAAVLLSLSHVAGAVFQVPTLLNLTGLRSWMWVALLSLPVVVDYWVARLESDRRGVGAAAVLLCVILPFVAGEYPLFWPLVASLLLVDLSENRLGPFALSLSSAVRECLVAAAGLVLLAWAGTVLTFTSPVAGTPLIAVWYRIAWGYGRMPAAAVRVIVFTLAGAGAIAAVAFNAWGRAALAQRFAVARSVSGLGLCAALVVPYAGVLGWDAWRTSRAALNPASSDAMLVDVQRWARDHTAPSSVFVTPLDGWRTLSQRRKVSPFTRESYAYVAPRAAKEWRDRVLTFYGIPPAEAEAKRGTAMLLAEMARFSRFTEREFGRFATEFGATHLVLPICYPVTDRTTFALPVLYKNPCFVVYRLDAEAFADARPPLDADALARAVRFRLDAATTAPAGAVAALRAPATPRLIPFSSTTRVNMPPESIDLKTGSIAVWARTTNPTKTYQDLIRVNGGSDLYLYREQYGTVVAFYGQVRLGATGVLADDRNWHHYVLTWEEGHQCLYVDGERRLSSFVANPVPATSSVALGWLGDGTDREQWEGAMTGVQTFSIALVPDEVRTLYRRGPGGHS